MEYIIKMDPPLRRRRPNHTHGGDIEKAAAVKSPTKQRRIEDVRYFYDVILPIAIVLLSVGLFIAYNVYGSNHYNVSLEIHQQYPIIDPMPRIRKEIPKEQRCNKGPYVYDKSHHLEGIGSTFQHRKYGFILASAIKARWVGTLKNEHENPYFDVDDDGLYTSGKDSLINYAPLFGFQQDECSEDDLLDEQTNKHLHFIYIDEDGYDYPDIEDLCKSISEKSIYPWPNITSNTIIVVDGDDLHENWNYCLFNSYFRNGFYNAQRIRKVIERPTNEKWISVHFRWGDTSTESVESPNGRAGASLSAYIDTTKHYIDMFNPKEGDSKKIMIHFFSEGQPDIFASFQNKFPSSTLHLNSSHWINALDIMSQSNVIIGGSSSFFALASHLCSNCTVVTTHPNSYKFLAEDEEILLAKHHELVDFPEQEYTYTKWGYRYKESWYIWGMRIMYICSAFTALVLAVQNQRLTKQIIQHDLFLILLACCLMAAMGKIGVILGNMFAK